nr:N-6 DNA methylase [Mycoplasmopsis bovis]
MFEDNDFSSYKHLSVDAVVSNPPYSQKWNSKEHSLDPRYVEYGIAPKSKADYAFLLHRSLSCSTWRDYGYSIATWCFI